MRSDEQKVVSHGAMQYKGGIAELCSLILMLLLSLCSNCPSLLAPLHLPLLYPLLLVLLVRLISKVKRPSISRINEYREKHGTPKVNVRQQTDSAEAEEVDAEEVDR